VVFTQRLRPRTEAFSAETDTVKKLGTPDFFGSAAVTKSRWLLSQIFSFECQLISLQLNVAEQLGRPVGERSHRRREKAVMGGEK
jgi:hypothetical protein